MTRAFRKPPLDITEAIGNVLAVGAGLFILWILLVAVWVMVAVMPVDMIAEHKCLDAGYPEHKTDVFLNTYCMTLDGLVKVRVEEIE